MIEQFRKEQVKKTWQTYSCKDGCIYTEKAVQLSNDPNSDDWLYKCKVLDLIIPMDGDIGKLGCGSFTKEAQETATPIMPLPVSDVHIQETGIKEPVAAPVPSELATASEQIIILEPAQPQSEPVPSEPMPSPPAYIKEERETVIQEPVPSEPMPKRKRGRPVGSKNKSKVQENDGDIDPQTQNSAKES
jgi:hypothetical protein